MNAPTQISILPVQRTGTSRYAFQTLLGRSSLGNKVLQYQVWGLLTGHEVARSSSIGLGKSFAVYKIPWMLQIVPEKQNHNDPRIGEHKTVRISRRGLSLDSTTAKAACKAYALARRHQEYPYYLHQYSYYVQMDLFNEASQKEVTSAELCIKQQQLFDLVHGISVKGHPHTGFASIADQAYHGYIQGHSQFETKKTNPVKDRFRSDITIYALLEEYNSDLSRKDFHRHLSPIAVPSSSNLSSQNPFIDLVVRDDGTHISELYERM